MREWNNTFRQRRRDSDLYRYVYWCVDNRQKRGDKTVSAVNEYGVQVLVTETKAAGVGGWSISYACDDPEWNASDTYITEGLYRTQDEVAEVLYWSIISTLSRIMRHGLESEGGGGD